MQTPLNVRFLWYTLLPQLKKFTLNLELVDVYFVIYFSVSFLSLFADLLHMRSANYVKSVLHSLAPKVKSQLEFYVCFFIKLYFALYFTLFYFITHSFTSTVYFSRRVKKKFEITVQLICNLRISIFNFGFVCFIKFGTQLKYLCFYLRCRASVFYFSLVFVTNEHFTNFIYFFFAFGFFLSQIFGNERIKKHTTNFVFHTLFPHCCLFHTPNAVVLLSL